MLRTVVSLLLVAIIGAQAGSKLQAISGGFHGADSLRADGLTVWSHTRGMFLPHSVGANTPSGFVSQWGTTATLGSDGSMYWLQGDEDYSPTVAFVANVTGNAISSRGVRLFGMATIFTVGQDTTPASDRNYNGNYIASLKAVGTGANQRLVVCLSPGTTAVSSPLYMRSGIQNRVQGPDPLATQLVEYPWSTFGKTLVQSTVAPNVITPDPTYGVDCTSMHAAGDNLYVRGMNPPVYWQRASSAWSQITGRGASNTSFIFGAGMGPTNTPNSQLRFSYDNAGVPTAFLYSLDPNTNPIANDTRKRIWKNSGGSSWQSVMGTDALDNLTLVDYTVGTNGDVYMLFNGQSDYAMDKYPPGEYVWKAAAGGQFSPVAPNWHLRDSDNGHLKPGTIRLHWDYSNPIAASLIIYGDLSHAVSTTGTRIATDPDKLQADDFSFFSRSFNNVARLTAAGDEWLPAYGGGFADPPSHVVSFFNSGKTYFIGTNDFVFQRYTGPVAVYRDDLGRWSDLYETSNAEASATGVPLDGGDFESIFPHPASVFDLDFVKVGSDDVAILGGAFRSGLKGTVQLNSIAVIPMQADGSAKPGVVCGLRHNTLVGVRDSTNGVPQNYLYQPGSVNSLEYVPETRQLFVIGGFDSAGDSPASNIAVFQFASSPSCVGGYYDGVWSEVAGGIDGSAYSMERIGDLLFVGGAFTRVGVNQFANNIAAYNLKTQQWEMLNAGLDGTVRRIQKFNGLIYVGGEFASGSGIELPQVAIWEKGRWHRPQIEKLRSQCGGGCSYVCANEVETCTPSWTYVVDMRQVSSEEIVFYGIKGNATGLLYSLNVVAKTGYWLLNSAGFSGVQDEDNALPLGKGLNADELYVWNLESPDNTYPVNYVSVFNHRYRNALYRQGTGVDGIVYSTWPDYDGKSYKKSTTGKTIGIIIGVILGVILLVVIVVVVWKFVLSGSSSTSSNNAGGYVLQQN